MWVQIQRGWPDRKVTPSEVFALRVTATYKPAKTTPNRKVISGRGYKETGMTPLAALARTPVTET